MGARSYPEKTRSGNYPEDDPQDDSENNDSRTIVDPQQVQGSTSIFERCFSTIYTFQSSVMSNLNRREFRHLQLAGVGTQISRQLQQKHLIPSRCHEMAVVTGMAAVTCSNTTQTVYEIKPCHGLHHDGWDLRGRRDKWMETERLYRHVPESGSLIETPNHAANNDQGGDFDSFNVCIECHDRDRVRRRPYQNFAISRFHSEMCPTHSLEYIGQRPYNACRCKMFVEKHWRCHTCSLDTLDELRLRAQTFGDVAHPTFTFDQDLRVYIDQRTGNQRKREVCPILGCTAPLWTEVPLEKQMWLCRACTAIFPPPQRQ